MGKEQGIGGIAVAAAAAGSLLIWSGIRGISVTKMLRELVKGEDPGDLAQDYPITAPAAGTIGGLLGGNLGSGGNTFTGSGTPGNIPAKDWLLAQSYGGIYGVDPLVLVAIGWHETQWGKLGAGRQGLYLGVGAYDSGPTMKFAGLANQLNQGAKILAEHGVHNIADIQAGKASWWATDPNWAQGVVSAYQRLKG